MRHKLRPKRRLFAISVTISTDKDKKRQPASAGPASATGAHSWGVITGMAVAAGPMSRSTPSGAKPDGEPHGIGKRWAKTWEDAQ